MAKKSNLKVFRTAIGFHDAYVAAPSQKAALEAWGASRNLFASGAAEVVTDPDLAAAALADPGVVLKVSRGSRSEQLAALAAGDRTAAKTKSRPAPIVVKARRSPRPSRGALDDADAKLTRLYAKHREDGRELARAEAALKKQRAGLEKRQQAERSAATAERDKAKHSYDRALKRWNGETKSDEK